MDRQQEWINIGAAATATGSATSERIMHDGGARRLVLLAALLGFTQTAQAQ